MRGQNKTQLHYCCLHMANAANYFYVNKHYSTISAIFLIASYSVLRDNHTIFSIFVFVLLIF